MPLLKLTSILGKQTGQHHAFSSEHTFGVTVQKQSYSYGRWAAANLSVFFTHLFVVLSALVLDWWASSSVMVLMQP